MHLIVARVGKMGWCAIFQPVYPCFLVSSRISSVVFWVWVAWNQINSFAIVLLKLIRRPCKPSWSGGTPLPWPRIGPIKYAFRSPCSLANLQADRSHSPGRLRTYFLYAYEYNAYYFRVSRSLARALVPKLRWAQVSLNATLPILVANLPLANGLLKKVKLNWCNLSGLWRYSQKPKAGGREGSSFSAVGGGPHHRVLGRMEPEWYKNIIHSRADHPKTHSKYDYFIPLWFNH